MNNSRFIKGFILSFVLFVLLDAGWHGGVMADFYNQRLALMNPDLPGAPGFSGWILFLEAINAFALTYFVLKVPTSKQPLNDGAWIGGLLGFVVTGSVNFLNHTLIPDWDVTLAIVDTAWGTALGLFAGIAVAAFCNEEKKGWFGWLKRW